MPLVYVNPNVRRGVLIVVGALMLTALVRQAPDIIRYLKIKSM